MFAASRRAVRSAPPVLRATARHLSSALPDTAPSLIGRPPRVLLGLSGGVDSAVSAYLLKRRGFDVHLVHMRNWDASDENNYCTGEQDLFDARRVASHLDLPLEEVSFSHEYWNDVFEPMLNEFTQGRTPNPDISCNRHIKFGYFLRYAFEKANADYLATGHYARVMYPTNKYAETASSWMDPESYAMLPGTAQVTYDPNLSVLARPTFEAAAAATDGSGGIDSRLRPSSSASDAPLSRSVLNIPEHHSFAADYAVGGAHAQRPPPPSARLISGIGHKDQTYFLSSVLGGHLDRVIFPLGHLPKEQVRAIALEVGLPVAAKTDSRGICFVGKKRSFVDFLDGYIAPRDRMPGFVTSPDGLASALTMLATPFFAKHNAASEAFDIPDSADATPTPTLPMPVSLTVMPPRDAGPLPHPSYVRSLAHDARPALVFATPPTPGAVVDILRNGATALVEPLARGATAAEVADVNAELAPRGYTQHPAKAGSRLPPATGVAKNTAVATIAAAAATAPKQKVDPFHGSIFSTAPPKGFLPPGLCAPAPAVVDAGTGIDPLAAGVRACQAVSSAEFEASDAAAALPAWQRAVLSVPYFKRAEKAGLDTARVALADALLLKGRIRPPHSTGPAASHPIEHTGLAHFTEGQRLSHSAFPAPYHCIRKLRSVNAVCVADPAHGLARRSSFIVRGFSWLSPFPPLLPSYDFTRLERSLGALAQWHDGEVAALLPRVRGARQRILARWLALARSHARSTAAAATAAASEDGHDHDRDALTEFTRHVTELVSAARESASTIAASSAGNRASDAAFTEADTEAIATAGGAAAAVTGAVAALITELVSLQRLAPDSLRFELAAARARELEAIPSRDPFNTNAALAPFWSYALTAATLFPLCDRALPAGARGMPFFAKIRSTSSLVPVTVTAERVPQRIVEASFSGRGNGITDADDDKTMLQITGLQSLFNFERSAGSSSAPAENVASSDAQFGPVELCLRVHLPEGFTEALTPGQSMALYRPLSAETLPTEEDAARVLWPPVGSEYTRFLGSVVDQKHVSRVSKFDAETAYECMGSGVIAV